MLTLDLYNNTALAGTPRSTTTNEFAIKLADPHTSSELYGTIDLKRGQQYTFHCEADGAPRFAQMHVDDHLLCQTGANSAPGTLTHHGSPLLAPLSPLTHSLTHLETCHAGKKAKRNALP